MTATALTDVATRLLANVQAGVGERADGVLTVSVTSYRDPARYRSEIEQIFHRVPLMVALSCDVARPGNHVAVEIAGRPLLVVRGDDGVARTFLNVCRHRGAQVACNGFGSARRFTCPYHAWVYDTKGALVHAAEGETFGDIDVTGLVELPCAERVGMVFAVLTPGAPIDVDAWLGDMASALAVLRLEELHRYEVDTELPSGNWKATADGYVDGYHLGYLHRASIGEKAITNRNTYDLYGPHVRVGFANKPIEDAAARPVEDWKLTDVMSLVHFVFPNISITGQPGRSLMLSRLLPGPTVDTCTVEEHHYARSPIDDELAKVMEQRRQLYASVTADEDFFTVLQVTKALAALPDDDVVRYGRNEPGNQNVHRWIDELVGGADPYAR